MKVFILPELIYAFFRIPFFHERIKEWILFIHVLHCDTISLLPVANKCYRNSWPCVTVRYSLMLLLVRHDISIYSLRYTHISMKFVHLLLTTVSTCWPSGAIERGKLIWPLSAFRKMNHLKLHSKNLSESAFGMVFLARYERGVITRNQALKKGER